MTRTMTFGNKMADQGCFLKLVARNPLHLTNQLNRLAKSIEEPTLVLRTQGGTSLTLDMDRITDTFSINKPGATPVES